MADQGFSVVHGVEVAGTALTRVDAAELSVPTGPNSDDSPISSMLATSDDYDSSTEWTPEDVIRFTRICMQVQKELLYACIFPGSRRSRANVQVKTTALIAGPCEAIDTPLSERGQLVLVALYEGQAFDSDRRMTTAQVSLKALGAFADANAIKWIVTKLVKSGFLGSKKGCDGGVWLTPKGNARAEKLALR